MDVQYLFLFQLLLFMAVFVAIRYVSCIKESNVCSFLNVSLIEDCPVLFVRFDKHLDKKKIQAYDKYQMWRYVEHRRASSFINEYYNIKENVINGEFSTNIWRNH